MAKPSPADRVPLMLSLPKDIARRLAQVAEAQKRPVHEVVLDVLDRNLPQADSGEKKPKIPYT
jgi:hypothetical protein